MKQAADTSQVRAGRQAIKRATWTAVAVALAGCTAAPPLNIYALATEPGSHEASMNTPDPPPAHDAPVVEVTRVTLPDYLDSRDLVVHRGDLLERSSTGRWASRLSLAATDFLTARLATRLPDVWLTDQPRARTADYRLMIHIEQLDITSAGIGTVEAEWEVVPRSSAGEISRHRTRFSLSAAVRTDEDIVQFERALLARLASEIDVSNLR